MQLGLEQKQRSKSYGKYCQWARRGEIGESYTDYAGGKRQLTITQKTMGGKRAEQTYCTAVQARSATCSCFRLHITGTHAQSLVLLYSDKPVRFVLPLARSTRDPS